MTDQALTPSAYEFCLGDETGPVGHGIPRDDFRNWFFVQAVPMSYSSVHEPDVYARHQQVVTRTHTSLGVMWARKKRPWKTLPIVEGSTGGFSCVICGISIQYDKGVQTHCNKQMYRRGTYPDGFAHIKCGDAEDESDGLKP